MTKIGAQFEYVAPFVERPVVAKIQSILNLLQRMTECLFAKAREVVSDAAETWRSEINRKARYARDAKSAAGNVRSATQLTDCAGVGADKANPKLVDLKGANGQA